MSLLNTAMNVIGTGLAVKSLFGGNQKNASSQPKTKMNNFMSEIRQAGVARTNLFEVVITAPPVMMGSKATAQKISLYAEGAALPGRSIETQEFSRYGYGPHEKFPYSMQFSDYTIQFIGDGRGEIYKFFYNWMQGIVKGDGDISPDNGFEVEFRDQYATTIEVFMFNEQGQTIMSSKMTNAFPIQMPDVSLSWGDSSMMQFSTTFAYTQAQLQGADKPFVGKNGPSFELTGLQKLVKIGTAVQALASIKRPSSIQDALSSVTTVKNVVNGF